MIRGHFLHLGNLNLMFPWKKGSIRFVGFDKNIPDTQTGRHVTEGLNGESGFDIGRCGWLSSCAFGLPGILNVSEGSGVEVN